MTPEQPHEASIAVPARVPGWFRRRRTVIALVVVVALLVVLGIVFHPAVQTHVAREQLGARLDAFAVERLHVLPWRARVRGLDMRHEGLELRVREAAVGYSPWRMLFDVLGVRWLEARGVELDVSDVPASEARGEPFGGLFAVLSKGYGVELGTLAARGRVRFDAERSLRFFVTGGGLAPEASGELELDVTVSDATDDSRVEVAGTVTLAQLEPGRFETAAADVLVRALSPRLPREEWLEVSATAAPVEVRRLDDDGEPDGWTVTGDRFRLAIAKPGDAGNLASVSVTGTLDGRRGQLAGTYEIAAGDDLVTFYLEDVLLPVFAQTGGGDWRFDLRTLALGVAYRGEVSVSGLERILGENEALPEGLILEHSFALEAGPDAVTLEAFDAVLRVPPGDTVFSFALEAPLEAATAEPLAVLAPKRVVGHVALDGMPLEWLNGLLPEPWLQGGMLAGAFDLRTGDGALELVPTEGLHVAAAELDAALGVQGPLGVHLAPTLAWTESRVRVRVPRAKVVAGETSLGALGLSAVLDTTADTAPSPDVKLDAEFDLNAIAAAIPALRAPLADQPLPAGLTARIDGDLSVNAARVRVRTLEVSLRQHDAHPILVARVLQPFAVALDAGGPAIRNPEGELALLSFDDLDLAWLDPLWSGGSLSGRLAAGEMAVEAGGAGTLEVRARRALDFRDVAVATPEGPLVDALALTVSPEVDYAPGAVDLRYRALEVRVDGQRLASGQGDARVPLPRGNGEAEGAGESPGEAADTPVPTSASGSLALTLAALQRVPALAEAVRRLPAERNWRLEFDYDVSGDAERIDVAALDARLAIDAQTHVRIRNEAPLVVRPRIAADEALAQHLTGALTAELSGLSSAVLGDLLPLGELAFDDVSTLAVLRSDGAVLTADTSRPLVLSGVRLGRGASATLAPFTVEAAASLNAAGARAQATLEALKVTFDAFPERPAIDGTLAFVLEPAHLIPLRRLDASLEGHLPPLLAQPAVMPGHRLRDGRFRLEVTVADDGAIVSDAVLDGLESSEPLAIAHAEAHAEGALAADGKGFRFQMPVSGQGRSGETDGLLVASYAPEGEDKALLELAFTSQRFLLNDVLATLDAVAAPRNKAARTADDKGEAGDAPAAAPGVEPDDTPFWDVLPYDTRFAYYVRDLYYTDYVIFNDVTGDIGITSDRLAFDSLAGRFHASPMRFDGALEFAGETRKPYQLELEGTLTDFDLNQFFTELVPGDKPRVEGLFSVAVNGYGASPNMAQFRNELLFDMRLKSREGLFRPLPPGSGLMAGASDVLGIVGEGLSYMPTGGFGAGALSRLVNYIAVIDYDRIDIHVERDETRDIAIRRFLVQSPTVSLTASGGIDYVDGVDILQSPLSLNAQLNMSGKGAAILYSMDLLSDEQDDYGYYLGPQFRIRGTPADAESNFDEIVTAAADGTLKGGITRPLSGLIGNIKHRWFGDEPDPYSGPPATDPPAGEPAGP